MLQAGVELERAALQTQLKAALQLHMLPRTSIKPQSPLDKTLTMLDMLLEVCWHVSGVPTLPTECICIQWLARLTAGILKSAGGWQLMLLR